eukprot:TRINITY_DN51530_c0_g1_i1.p1 TRINITY_DN51530_c0_g1~~TRINITY_DN51530_c0_g1_i1.p1  ORF type:complete len:150 (+),score=44.82 TRINITY_DN51530_c0_g1_i1:101-550(+)
MCIRDSNSSMSRGMPVSQHDVHQPTTTTTKTTRVTVRSAGTVSDLHAHTGGGGDDILLDDGHDDGEEEDILYASAGAVNMQLHELRDMMLGAGHSDYIEWCEAAAREREMLLHEQWDLSLIHISEPTRLLSISYAVFCLKKKKMNKRIS